MKRKTRGLACGIVKSLTKETMTTELKLCKDCRYFKTKMGKIEECTAVIKSVDYEYGNNVYPYAYTQRYPYGNCKPEAILFEQNTSLWYKLKNIFCKPS